MEEDPDIDIDETTLIYPRIESIYSDVNIKTEPIDIDEDEYDSIEIAESSSEYSYIPFPNKIILGSKPSTLVQPEPTPGPSTASDNWEDQGNFECAECNIVFSTQNELDSHKMASHSFLVARPMSRAIKTERISVSSNSSRSFLEESSSKDQTVRRQKAVKSTSKSALNKTFPVLHNALQSSTSNPYSGIINPVAMSEKKNMTDKGDGLLCKHCDVRFPNEIALIKHTYALLLPYNNFECEFCQMTFDSKFALKGHRANHFKKTGVPNPSKAGDTMLQCLYCTCFLIYPGFMKKHLMNNHKTVEFAVKHVKFSGKCAVCSKSISSYKLYNGHMLKYHQKIFLSKTPYQFNSTPVKMKCFLCNQIFTSRYAAYKHKAEKHPEHSQKRTFNTVHEKPIKQLPANPKPPSKPKLPKPKNLLGNKTYVPKQNLFKCNKCQIHFVSCTAAFAHSKRCSLAKGDWKCNRCRRSFTKAEKFLHTQQHSFSEKLKVHIVCDKILSKVLCRCPKCELLFDEVAFNYHVSDGCVPKSGVDCKSCNLKIYSDSHTKHMRYHNKYNFSSSDFIIIDFVDVSYQNAPVKAEKIGQHKQKLFYCTTCQCHFYRIKAKLKFHMNRECETSLKKCCAICGLNFSRKSYMKHMSYDHNTLNLKLSDIVFVRLQDWKVINPVMPDFFQCTKCEVRFITPLSKNNHSCSKQVFVKCAKCSQKYDSVTYDIHLTFHDYGRSKTENKSPSILLKFYACMVCNYGFPSYDRIVEHCQNHYINSEDLAMKPCRVCKLNCADDHKILHSNRAKFEILKFDYEKLLTNDWLDGFGTVSKNVVEDILSKSVYGFMRNIRLELLVEGSAERTLYKCAQCELNFEQEHVVEHTTESCCSIPRFDCTSCTASFKTRIAKKSHMNVHVIYGDDIIFREIIFNYENDTELNEALRTGRKKESLKFRKCQQCKLLIKKSDFQAHISIHDKKEEIQQFTFRRTNTLLTYKLFKPVNSTKKLYTVYKCKSCNACIMKKANMHRHKCGPPDRYEKCNKCSLYFLCWNRKRHIALHAIIPKFVPKNISVIEFQILINRGDILKKRRRYSSDDDASMGCQVNLTLSKTYDTRKVKGRPYSDNLSEDSQDNVLNNTSTKSPNTLNAYAKKYIRKRCIEKVDSDNESQDSPTKIEDNPIKKKILSEAILDIDKWKMDMKSKLYQCKRCYLCFPNKQLLVSHVTECDDTTLSETPLSCDRCGIVFHPSLLSFHEKLHELVRDNPIENYFYLINISTNGVNMHNELQWLYKCQLCDIHYLNVRSLERHFSVDHNLTEMVNCEICGLQFTIKSRTRHMRIQHIEGKFSKDDLHIEITEKKIVEVGEISLSAFVKTLSRDIKGTVKIEETLQNKGQHTDSTIEREESMNVEKSALLRKESCNEDSHMETDAENDTDFSKNDQETSIDHNLYKCDKCSKHYLTKLALIRHLLDTTHKEKPFRCDICGLHFGKRTLDMHKSVQHGQFKLGLEDFIISNLTRNKNESIIKKEEVDSESLNDVYNSSDELNSSVEFNRSQSEEQTDSLTEEIKAIKSQVKSGVSGPIDNHIYKCVECSLYYTNKRTLLLHIVIKKHKQIEFSKCYICGLMFGKGSLKKHIKVQHEKLNLTRKDFIVTDVFGSRLLDDENDQSSTKNALSIDTNDFPLVKLETKNALEDEEILNDKFIKEKDIKILKLYQCKDCRVCVQKTAMKLHVCCSDIQKKQCIKCCLLFRNNDFIQHLRLHRKYQELSRKNYVLIRFGRRTAKNPKIYKCVFCSTHFLSLNALEWHMNILNHQTKRDYCKTCGLFFAVPSLSRHIYTHHNKMNLMVEQLCMVYVSDAEKNVPNIQSNDRETNNLNNSLNITVSELEATPNIKTIKKLFKCIECDVYFLTRASYYQHIYKHRKLDATEYVDCNICDFQFLNESLGVHMKSHKDKTFCLDKLLIEEYQPNSTDSPKIECYFAKDSLNSKLVSTTTPFDNDDESVLNHTDEQLSVIDSTSDEVPKEKIGKMINVSNSYTRNSASNQEEGSLNPIVVMPKLDD